MSSFSIGRSRLRSQIMRNRVILAGGARFFHQRISESSSPPLGIHSRPARTESEIGCQSTYQPKLWIPGLQRVLDFYRLACTPQFQMDGQTPLLNGYQATMIGSAGAKLTELRDRMPDAGGLVIAPSSEMAEYMAALIELIEGERPILVHSQMPNAETIKAFRNTDKRWIVSVAMISEGVDIRRLRVLIYLPNALTELAFRQAIGRVVRTAGPADDTRAYVVMPSFETFEGYARRVGSNGPSAYL